MLFENDWCYNLIPKYSRQEVNGIISTIFIRMVEFYNIGMLRDMAGPASINVIDGHRMAFTAKSIPIKLTDPTIDAFEFSRLLADLPKDYKPKMDPQTFKPIYETPIAYVSLYSWRDDGVIGTLRASCLTQDTLDRHHNAARRFV